MVPSTFQYQDHSLQATVLHHHRRLIHFQQVPPHGLMWKMKKILNGSSLFQSGIHQHTPSGIPFQLIRSILLITKGDRINPICHLPFYMDHNDHIGAAGWPIDSSLPDHQYHLIGKSRFCNLPLANQPPHWKPLRNRKLGQMRRPSVKLPSPLHRWMRQSCLHHLLWLMTSHPNPSKKNKQERTGGCILDWRGKMTGS